MASKTVTAAASLDNSKPEEAVYNNTENAAASYRLELLLRKISEGVRMRPESAAEIWASVRKARR